VGPIAELPQMKRIVVAHQIHHTNKFGGVPWGMFLGPQELEAIPGGRCGSRRCCRRCALLLSAGVVVAARSGGLPSGPPASPPWRLSAQVVHLRREELDRLMAQLDTSVKK
jgi:hypothetical protein